METQVEEEKPRTTSSGSQISNDSRKAKTEHLQKSFRTKKDLQDQKRLPSNLESTISRSVRIDRKSSPEFILCVCENIYKQVGFTIFSTFTSDLVIGTISDNAFYEHFQELVDRYPIFELWLPDTNIESSLEKTLVEKKVLEVQKIFRVSKHLFNETKGGYILKSLTRKLSNFSFDENYLALGALFAFFNFFFSSKNASYSQLTVPKLKISSYIPEKYLSLNQGARNTLEEILKRPILTAIKPFTPGGFRLLRGTLLMPFGRKEEIKKAESLIRSLEKNPSLVKRILQNLPYLSSFELLAIKLLHSPAYSSEASLIKSYRLVQELVSCLPYAIELFKVEETEKSGNSYDKIFTYKLAEKLLELHGFLSGKFCKIKVNAKNKHSLVFLLSKSSALSIELAQNTYSLLLAQLFELYDLYKQRVKEAQLGDLYLEVSSRFNHRLKLRIKIFHDNYKILLEKVLKEPILLQNFKDHKLIFTTVSFSCLAHRLDKLATQILAKNFDVVRDLILQAQAYIPYLANVSGELSRADMTISLLKFLKLGGNSCNCVFLESCHLYLRLKADDFFSQNRKSNEILDLFFKKPGVYFQAMNSKKATYFIEKILLIILLSQIGCPIPVEIAAFPIFKRIFVQLDHSISSEKNISSFTSEMLSYSELITAFEEDSSSLFIFKNFLCSTNQKDIPKLLKPLSTRSRSHSRCFCVIMYDESFLSRNFDRHVEIYRSVKDLRCVDSVTNFFDNLFSKIGITKKFATKFESQIKIFKKENFPYICNISDSYFDKVLHKYSDFMLQLISRSEFLMFLTKNSLIEELD